MLDLNPTAALEARATVVFELLSGKVTEWQSGRVEWLGGLCQVRSGEWVVLTCTIAVTGSSKKRV